MKGKLNGKEFNVYKKTAINDEVTDCVSSYILDGYRIRPELDKAHCDFVIDLVKGRDESLVRIEAYEFKEEILKKMDYEPHKIVRYCGAPRGQKPSRAELNPDSCLTVTVTVTEYPSEPDKNKIIARRSGNCVSKTVFYKIPGQEIFVKERNVITEILAERIRREERRMIPAYYVLPESAKLPAMKLLKKRGKLARVSRPERIGQVIHIYDHSLCSAKFMVFPGRGNRNKFHTVLGGLIIP